MTLKERFAFTQAGVLMARQALAEVDPPARQAARALEEAEQALFLAECSAADALRELEMNAILGPESLLPIWD